MGSSLAMARCMRKCLLESKPGGLRSQDTKWCPEPWLLPSCSLGARSLCSGDRDLDVELTISDASGSLLITVHCQTRSDRFRSRTEGLPMRCRHRLSSSLAIKYGYPMRLLAWDRRIRRDGRDNRGYVLNTS